MQTIGPILAAVLAFGSLAYFIVQRLRGGGGSKISAINGDEVGERVKELIALLDSFETDLDSRDFYVNELRLLPMGVRHLR